MGQSGSIPRYEGFSLLIDLSRINLRLNRSIGLDFGVSVFKTLHWVFDMVNICMQTIYIYIFSRSTFSLTLSF